MPVTRPSTPASRMMLTALGEAYRTSPPGLTRSTPSPAWRSVENGRPRAGVEQRARRAASA